MFKCQSGQCNLDCDGEKTICNTPCHGGQQCNCTGGAICEMPCSADNCNMTCGNGSVCDFDCNNDNGDMICQKGSLCEMECAAGAQNCRASCAPGADCILVIPEVTTGLNIDRSGMVGCDNPTVCSNRVWICGDYFSCPQRSAPALLQEINNGLSLAHRHPPAMHRTSP